KSFMDYFGINTVSDLPQLKDLHVEQNEIGAPLEFIEEPVNAETISTEEIVETNVQEEIVNLDDAVEITDLPDRKSIYMDHQEKNSEAQNEISSEENEDNSY